MPDVRIVPAEPRHISHLGKRLRAEDRAELQAMGIGCCKALWQSYRHSIFSRVALVDGELAAAWGMAGCPLGRVGQPWLLTAEPVERAKVAFVREAREEVAKMLSICPSLYGYVDARYRKAIRLLEMLGFEVDEPFPYGTQGASFRRYWIERP
jgi:hypothetical protein